MCYNNNGERGTPQTKYIKRGNKNDKRNHNKRIKKRYGNHI